VGFWCICPVSSDWLDDLNTAVIRNLPNGCDFLPTPHPGIKYISRKDIDEMPRTVFDGCSTNEADEIIEDVLSKLYYPWDELSIANINLKIERYKPVRFGTITYLELTIHDRLCQVETEMVYRIDNERTRIR
jgi:hypothetical protein